MKILGLSRWITTTPGFFIRDFLGPGDLDLVILGSNNSKPALVRPPFFSPISFFLDDDDDDDDVTTGGDLCFATLDTVFERGKYIDSF